MKSLARGIIQGSERVKILGLSTKKTQIENELAFWEDKLNDQKSVNLQFNTLVNCEGGTKDTSTILCTKHYFYFIIHYILWAL